MRDADAGWGKREACESDYDAHPSSVIPHPSSRFLATRRKYFHRQFERPLLLRVQRAHAHDLTRHLLPAIAEYRQDYRILPRLARARMLDRALHTERREARWRSPRPV